MVRWGTRVRQLAARVSQLSLSWTEKTLPASTISTSFQTSVDSEQFVCTITTVLNTAVA